MFWLDWSTNFFSYSTPTAFIPNNIASTRVVPTARACVFLNSPRVAHRGHVFYGSCSVLAVLSCALGPTPSGLLYDPNMSEAENWSKSRSTNEFWEQACALGVLHSSVCLCGSRCQCLVIRCIFFH